MKTIPTIASHVRPWLAGSLLFVALGLQAADPSGSWTWVAHGRNGGPDRTNTLTLKVVGGALSGSLAFPGREGKVNETQLTNARLEGDAVNFTIERKVNGNAVVAKYSGKVTGDKIAGKIETEHDGKPQSRDWEAQRVPAGK